MTKRTTLKEHRESLYDRFEEVIHREQELDTLRGDLDDMVITVAREFVELESKVNQIDITPNEETDLTNWSVERVSTKSLKIRLYWEDNDRSQMGSFEFPLSYIIKPNEFRLYKVRQLKKLTEMKFDGIPNS